LSCNEHETICEGLDGGGQRSILRRTGRDGTSSDTAVKLLEERKRDAGNSDSLALCIPDLKGSIELFSDSKGAEVPWLANQSVHWFLDLCIEVDKKDAYVASIVRILWISTG
jgi:hypothetical protein